MSKVFVIGELACTWLHGGLEAAYRGIEAIKAAGADAAKFQWTSDPEAMAMRRGTDRDKYKRLGWAGDCLPKLKEKCDEVGIEFMVTTFIPKDVELVAPYVSRFKVSAFESEDLEHLSAHGSRPVIVSVNPDKRKPVGLPKASFLWCISRYPAEPESLELSRLHHQDGLRPWDGFSDHTCSTLTGAVAVGAGARIIEKHVRLEDTPKDDPDYGHSLMCDWRHGFYEPESITGEPRHSPFAQYVHNIREAERML